MMRGASSLPDDFASLLGVDEIQAGPMAADHSLTELFETASRVRGNVKLLRLAAPKGFRHDITSFVAGGGQSITPGFRMLLDPNLSGIEVMLSNPYSDSFLARMDAERKGTDQVWRVRNEVLEFVSGLLRAGQQRQMQGQTGITIGLHSSALFWNLGIAAGTFVTVRAYEPNATGHDGSVAELRLRTGSRARLAEALIAYYERLKEDVSTVFISSPRDLALLGAWPSIYKGNAIWILGTGTIEKGCVARSSYLAELAWCSLPPAHGDSVYFKPVRLVRVVDREEHSQPSMLCLHRIQGITCRELALRVQDAVLHVPAHAAVFEELLGALGFQALQALAEFRRLGGETVKIRSHLRRYPWQEKLGLAISECGRFVTRDRNMISKCVSEAGILGRELLKGDLTPFRDSTLKNRIVKCEENNLTPSTMYQWISSTDPTHSFRWLRENTFDHCCPVKSRRESVGWRFR